VKPHIACPTTSGTGSETTGIAIFALKSINAKTGIISRRLIPDVALIDPTVTRRLPKFAVAATGFDLHESRAGVTDRPAVFRAALNPLKGANRPVSQERIRSPDTACDRGAQDRGALARACRQR
jgi:hypothetical protein